MRARRLEAGELAWIAALPCGLLTVALVLWLGPAFGRAFLGPSTEAFWSGTARAPEPVEHGRYAMALLGPLLLAAAILLARQRAARLRPGTAAALTRLAHAALAALLVLCLLAQENVLLRAYVPPEAPDRVFAPRTLAAAVLVAAVLLLAPRSARVRVAARRLARETPRRRAACLLLAAATTALWLLTAVNSDGSIGLAQGINLIPWQLDETFAVLDGRTPLVDFHAQYGQLLPYLPAGAMALLGASIAVWSSAMVALSGAALLAVYAVLRRIVRSSALALAAYVPFMATGFFLAWGTSTHRFGMANVFSVWPMRYGGAYLVAWLLARHADGTAPRRATLLLGVAGLAAINNPEFGAGAFAGALAALACLRRPRSWRAAGSLLGAAAAGLLGAIALVCLLTLLRAGALPRISLWLEFPRLFGVEGWLLQPLTPFGLHIAFYATFAAALSLAVVRSARRAPEAVLTAMLAWSGAFGLLAGSYFVGRSERLDLLALLSAWCLALVLLLIAAARDLAARGWRAPAVPHVALAFAFGLAVCSLAQAPAPWTQVARLGERTPIPVFHRPEATAFVARALGPGERVAIAAPLGHRIAYDLHIANESPYSAVEAMPLVRQSRETAAQLRRDGVRHVFLGIDDATVGDVLPQVAGAFERAGFSPGPQGAGMVELDARAARPPAR
jgi:hypothetical protein